MVVDPQNLLAQVSWDVRKAFQQLAAAYQAQTGLGLKVRSARRTCQEQAEQYGIGRTYNLNSATVTNAQGCQSWHVAGRAIDADPIDLGTGKLVATCEQAGIAGTIWHQMGGVWGGTFPGFAGPCGDQGHFEWHPGLSLSQVCPSPGACEAVSAAIQTQAPVNPWLWALGGVLCVSALWLALGAVEPGRRVQASILGALP